jgi:hypothetical protein
LTNQSNWKTTLSGIIIFIMGGLSALFPQHRETASSVMAIAAALGLVFAQDAKRDK